MRTQSTRTRDDFALLGSPPTFPERLHVGRPNLGDRTRLMTRIDECLDRRWLTNDGPLVKQFESMVKRTTGVKHCIAMCNATVALEILFRALGCDGEVIVPSFTFVATAHALRWQGIVPVFCDISPETHNIDPEKARALIGAKTKGIIGVHCWGRPCEIRELQQVASDHSLWLAFDAAHAFGCTYHGTPIGNFGSAEVFSFHATKFVNCGEGGAIVTNDDDLAAKLRFMRNFGFSDYDSVGYVGTNGKMPELSAALGITSLESMQEFTETNKLNHLEYTGRLRQVDGLTVMQYLPTHNPNYQYVIVDVDRATYGLSRDQTVRLLHAENVLARRYFFPGCHEMEPYRTELPNAKETLPVTEKVTQRLMALPTGTAVCEQAISAVCSILADAHAHSAYLSSRI